MLECIVIQFIMGYNNITDEYRQLYRCNGESYFRYLNPPKQDLEKVNGIYSISDNVIILEERFGL